MSYPHRHRSTSQWTFPLQGAIRTYPVPLERRDRLGLFSTPAVWFAHGGESRNPRTHCKKKKRRAAQHIRLSRIDGAYEHLCVLPLLSSLAPLHFYASRCTVASRFRRQPRGCGYIVGGLRTACYLPAPTS